MRASEKPLFTPVKANLHKKAPLAPVIIYPPLVRNLHKKNKPNGKENVDLCCSENITFGSLTQVHQKHVEEH